MGWAYCEGKRSFEMKKRIKKEMDALTRIHLKAQ